MTQPTARQTAPKGAHDTSFTVLSAIGLCHLLNDMMQSLLPAIYPTLKAHFQLSFTQVGMITLAFQCTASLLQPMVGYFADIKPMPYSLALGMVSTFLGLLVLSIAPNYAVILIAAMMVGLGSAVFHPEASRVARMASGGRYGLAQSVFQVGGNTGQAISPLIAAMVEPSTPVSPTHRVEAARHLMNTIRIAAARQHLDAVLIYEVAATADQKSNPLKFADWTLIGAFVLPSQNIKAVGVAQAMLIDVRNGYPYGQVTSSVDDGTASTLFYASETRTALNQKVADAAVAKLASESEGMIRRLRIELAALPER